ncbi:BQ5605_C013g07122 [Microbotryum silenes-dioicae]|uniref:BQ5605_C013g07122 protein n=1 Tax=Microbotryum silenes-dioicae TaxID=796604 RepID=A0A2X0LQY9_9BASI|nr:BQ5605_C013g07122 [Microbotryum silenes-dioicae]
MYNKAGKTKTNKQTVLYDHTSPLVSSLSYRLWPLLPDCSSSWVVIPPRPGSSNRALISCKASPFVSGKSQYANRKPTNEIAAKSKNAPPGVMS